VIAIIEKKRDNIKHVSLSSRDKNINNKNNGNNNQLREVNNIEREFIVDNNNNIPQNEATPEKPSILKKLKINNQKSLDRKSKNEESNNDKEEITNNLKVVRNNSKYSSMFGGSKIEEQPSKYIVQNLKNEKKVIVFRSKSREKKIKRAIEEKMESTNNPERMKLKSLTLANKMKSQFDKIKLSDLKVPEKLDNYVDEKFIRDKSDITKDMEKLTRELRNENYFDKGKLALNIFEDFEKQECWQSYTTLLFADLSNGESNARIENLQEKQRPGKTSSFKI